MRLLSLWVTFLFVAMPASVFAKMVGDPPLPDFLQKEEAATAQVVDLSYDQILNLRPGQLQLDTAIAIGRLRVDTPYLWGGDSWEAGVDCSHFTRNVFDAAATEYRTYMQTAQLRDVVDSNGLRRIPAEDMQPGDLLVYGYYNDEGAWSGHVVILIDADFTAGGFQGLVLGSHGDVGVQFLTVAGFPGYFRKPHIELRNVLRVVARDLAR